MKRFLRKNWFLFGIAAALLCGYFFRNAGAFLNPANRTNSIIIIIMFFISGSLLPAEAVKSGLRELKLHIYVQLFIFLFFPLFIFLTSIPLREAGDGKIIVGLYALACLPTTVSSCVIFTQSAGGNVVGAMFNASLANLIGVVISPLILSLMLQSGGQGFAPGEVLQVLKSLALKLLVPILAGQLLRRFLREQIEKVKKTLRLFSNILILFMIFLAFSKTALHPSFARNLRAMTWPFLYLAAVHIVLVAAALFGSRLLHLSGKSRITAVFTAPQKTAAMGVPLVSTFFADKPEILGIALLPLVFYHSYQLLVAGVLKGLPFITRE